MITKLKKWWKARKARKNLEYRADGFFWAIRAYVQESYTISQIEAYIHCGIGGNQCPFDLGAADAIPFIIEYDRMVKAGKRPETPKPMETPAWLKRWRTSSR